MAKLDYSLPISDLVRESTKEAHANVEHSSTAVALLRGELSVQQYTRFLMMLWHMYDALEQGLERHSNHPVLEPTYNPTLLARAPALEADIAYLLDVSESTWKSHPLHHSLVVSPPEALTAYVARLRELAESDDPSPLLAHAYVRYLGDLSGGQTIRQTIAKAYDLESPGPGLSFYEFKELRSSDTANLGELRRIKDWYRDGMNKGVGDDVVRKAVVAQEAARAFQFTHALFDAIGEEMKLDSRRQAEELKSREEGYSVAQIASVIAAVGLAHFILVVGGFTGARGYAKLLSVEDWLTSLFNTVST